MHPNETIFGKQRIPRFETAYLSVIHLSPILGPQSTSVKLHIKSPIAHTNKSLHLEIKRKKSNPRMICCVSSHPSKVHFVTFAPADRKYHLRLPLFLCIASYLFKHCFKHMPLLVQPRELSRNSARAKGYFEMCFKHGYALIKHVFKVTFRGRHKDTWHPNSDLALIFILAQLML